MIKNKKPVVHIVKLAFSLLFTISVTVALSSFFYASEIMSMLYPGANIESSRILSILMFGFIAISGIYVFGTLLTANGSLKHLNIIAGSAIALNLLFNIILIPQIQAVGSAYASLSAQTISVILQALIVQRIFKFRMNFNFLLSLLAFASGVTLAGYLTSSFAYNWIINLAIMLSISFLLAWILGLLSIRGFIQIIKDKE
jgi:O-antigen/teichoic acid export membrane protein